LPDVPELTPPQPQNIAIQPFDIAIIIDNVVYQVLNCDGTFASQLLAQPLFIQVLSTEAKVGWIYNPEDGSFTPPVISGL
jgi:hypothetical protein